MLAGAHKKFYRIQHPEIYLLDLKVQYKHKIKLPLDMVRKHVFLYLCLPDYNHKLDFQFHFRPRLIFNMAAVKELSAIFLFHCFLKLYSGEITIVCRKSEQSGHYDKFTLYNTAVSATTWLSHATKKLSAICLSRF